MSGEELHPDFPVIEGRYQMTATWSVELPVALNQRFEESDMVLWRPGLTFWIAVWGNDNNQPVQERLDWLRSEASPDATDVEFESPGGAPAWLCYRLEEEGGPPDPSLYGYAVGEFGHVQLAALFDSPGKAETAKAVLKSFSEMPG